MEESVNDLAYSGTDDILLACSGRQLVRFQVSKKGELSELWKIGEAHDSNVICVSLKGGRCITGSSDPFVKMWDVESSKMIHKFTRIHSFEITSLHMGRDSFLSTSHDNLVALTDVQKMCTKWKINSHTNSVTKASFWKTKEGNEIEELVWSCSWDKSVKLFDQRSANISTPILEVNGFEQFVTTFTARDNLLFASSGPKISVFDIRKADSLRSSTVTSSPISELHHTKGMVFTIDLHGNRVLSAGTTGDIYFWKNWMEEDKIIQSKHKLFPFHVHSANKIVSDSCLIFTASSDRKIKVHSFAHYEDNPSHKREKLLLRMAHNKRKMKSFLKKQRKIQDVK